MGCVTPSEIDRGLLVGDVSERKREIQVEGRLEVEKGDGKTE